MIKAEELVNMFGNKPNEQIIKFGSIDSSYITGRPRILFDGESVVSGKQYLYLSSYSPSPGDRVIIVSGVVIGKIV